MARATHTCNDVYQVENKVKFLTAKALRGVNSLIFDAQEQQACQRVGQADYVTGTALEQGCDLDKAVVVQRQAPMVQNSAQSSEAQQSQFIDENIDITVSAQRQNPSKSNAFRRPSRFHRGFRRSWRFLSCSTLSKWSMSMLRIQKTAQMPQVQFIEKLVDDTVLRRTSSGSPSPTANSRDVFRFRFRQFDRVVNTPAVQPTASLPGAEPPGKSRRLSRRHRCSSRR